MVSCPSQVSTQVRTRNREKKLRLGVGSEYGCYVNGLRGPGGGRLGHRAPASLAEPGEVDPDGILAVFDADRAGQAKSFLGGISSANAPSHT